MPDLPPSRSVVDSVGRDACSAGTMPNSSAVTTDTIAAIASTRTSMATSDSRGSVAGSEARRTSTAQYAIATPMSVPAHDKTRLSTSSPRASCQREAPSAARMLTSRPRALARASIRLATLTQAMSSTNPTAPSSISIHDLTLAPTM